MTLEEYYKAENEIKHKEPEKASLGERVIFYKKEIEKLRSQLSPKDLEKVLEDVRRFQKKMQSGVS